MVEVAQIAYRPASVRRVALLSGLGREAWPRGIELGSAVFLRAGMTSRRGQAGAVVEHVAGGVGIGSEEGC